VTWPVIFPVVVSTFPVICPVVVTALDVILTDELTAVFVMLTCREHINKRRRREHNQRRVDQLSFRIPLSKY
jgi:hypothetical protein